MSHMINSSNFAWDHACILGGHVESIKFMYSDLMCFYPDEKPSLKQLKAPCKRRYYEDSSS